MWQVESQTTPGHKGVFCHNSFPIWCKEITQLNRHQIKCYLSHAPITTAVDLRGDAYLTNNAVKKKTSIKKVFTKYTEVNKEHVKIPNN